MFKHLNLSMFIISMLNIVMLTPFFLSIKRKEKDKIFHIEKKSYENNSYNIYKILTHIQHDIINRTIQIRTAVLFRPRARHNRRWRRFMFLLLYMSFLSMVDVINMYRDIDINNDKWMDIYEK